MKTYRILLLLALSLILGFGCENKEESEVASAPIVVEETQPAPPTTASIQIRIDLDAKSTAKLFNALGTVDDIAGITVKATKVADSSLIDTTELTLIAGSWQGAMSELPYETEILFGAQAINAEEVVIFSGTLTKALVAGENDPLIIKLASIDDGIQPDVPTIVSAMLPAKVLVDSDPVFIGFQIDHPNDVEFTLAATGAKVAANPDDNPVTSYSGIHTPTADLVAYFFAPSAAGEASVKLTVKDANQTDTAGAVYAITIVVFDSVTWTDPGVGVVFGPAITAMSFERSESTLKITAATEPTTGLTYDWTGTGSFADLAANGNPIFLAGFNDDMAGDITVTVTDSDGIQAFLVRTINAGDYPYTVDDYILDMPGIYIYDEVTGLLWADNTNLIQRKWSDAAAFCQSLDLVGYAVWRLPTVNELVNMYERRFDFSHYELADYWSSDPDPTDQRQAMVVSYDDGSVSSVKINPKQLLRCVKE